MIKKLLLASVALAACVCSYAQKSYRAASPDGKLVLEVTAADRLGFELTHDGTSVVSDGTIGLTLEGGVGIGTAPKVTKVQRRSVAESIASPFYTKSEVADIYNEMTLSLKGDAGVIFRLYDEGMAYRFFTRKIGEVVVSDEVAEYGFADDYPTFTSYVNTEAKTFEEQFGNSFEQPYHRDALTKLNAGRLKILPLMVALADGKKLVITEADLRDYPGMFLNNSTESPRLTGVFAPYPKKEENLRTHHMIVTEREDFIARTDGTRSFPWRIFAVSETDCRMADCDMVYRLASPSRVEDTSWIKPGKVAWEWWNASNISGVDFRAGINNATYKYYIDFASANGIEYVILDEGWSVRKDANLFSVVPAINLEELVAYAAERNVGLILWAGYNSFHRNMDAVVEHYSKMGIKGFKIDFMDRDDQKMIDFMWRAADLCARNRMLVDFHGCCKPTGLSRTYPNVVNYEGVNGLEQMKWAPATLDQVVYDVTIPFVRMVAGPMDYTQGAMRNASKGNYRAVFTEPMSQGTRCRQLAEYVIFESPLNMMCDSPTAYMKEQECTDFIAGVPTVWDGTVSLDGRVGEYVAMARRSGGTWYVGAMTDWSARELTLDLSFLGEGGYTVELFRDGVNASKKASDYKREKMAVPADRQLKIRMAPGGGFAAKITKDK